MKKLIGAAVAAGATIACAGTAHAEISGNIQLTSDYVFRGISLSDGSAAIQGGFDWSNDQFYVGTWGSSLNSGGGANAEIDVYAGWTPKTGPVDWDLGVITYNYPGADDDGAEFDYYELKAAGTFNFNDTLHAGASIYWSPENFGKTGDARYWEVNGEYDMSDMWHFTAAYGNQQIDHPGGGSTPQDDYNTWNIGATMAMHGFEIDLRYNDTDIDAGSPIEAYTFGPASYDASYVLTIKREL
ncbi:MAG: TorF family putative porin [Terricaulis sp.]